jgi:hypothetical protein
VVRVLLQVLQALLQVLQALLQVLRALLALLKVSQQAARAALLFLCAPRPA